MSTSFDHRAAPAPFAATAGDGLKDAREAARRYLPNAVKFLAAAAFSDDSPASVHSRILATKELIAIAAVIPEGISTFPSLSQRESDENGDAADDRAVPMAESLTVDRTENEKGAAKSQWLGRSKPIIMS